MYRIRNTADDRSKAHLHRKATKMIYEPSIAGRRLQLRGTLDLTDKQFEQNREMLVGWEAKGMIEIEFLRTGDVDSTTGRTGKQEAVEEGRETAKFEKIELPPEPPAVSRDVADSGWTNQEPRAGTPPAPDVPPLGDPQAEGTTKRGPRKRFT